MDPITQRILNEQRAITDASNFSGYEPSNTDGIAAFNNAPVNENLMSNDTFIPSIDFKSVAKNVGKNLVTNYAVKKIGLEGLKANVLKSVLSGGPMVGLNNPLTAAFTVGSLLPDAAKGIAGVLRNNRAQKAIERDIMRDLQGTITTSNPTIANIQPTAQDTARGGGNVPASPRSTPAAAPTQSRHTSGAGGLHSGY